MQIPLALKKNLLDLYPLEAKDWLGNLPAFLQRCEQHFHMRLSECYSDVNFNYVAPAQLNNGSNAVFKCTIANKLLKNEADTLHFFAGRGAVKLLDFDINWGMLLEQVYPGCSLENYERVDEQGSLAIEVMRKLHHSCPKELTLPTLKEWIAGFQQLRQHFNGSTGPFPSKLIDKAESLAVDLLKSPHPLVVLHGDLHYGNILFSKAQGWLAIDPKGVIGEPEFEIPLPRLNGALDIQRLQKNVDQFIALSNFDRTRVLHWLLVKATLAAWWSYEDKGIIHQPFLETAYYFSIVT